MCRVEHSVCWLASNQAVTDRLPEIVHENWYKSLVINISLREVCKFHMKCLTAFIILDVLLIVIDLNPIEFQISSFSNKITV